MPSNTTNKKISLPGKKLKCEMCGNEALRLHTLCKEHLQVRTAEQLKGRDYTAKPASGSSVN